MTKYENTKYDFKKYLLDHLNDSYQEELIFWKKSIPLPIDLVYKIYDERSALIGTYCGHILSIAIMERYFSEVNATTDSLYELPSSNCLNGLNANNIYNKYYSSMPIQNLQELLKNTFKFHEYGMTENEFVVFITHEGRKYKRLYVPRDLKMKIAAILPNINSAIGVSNGDMFGNIVADYLKIYRSGFSDAFAAIFNKLLDFNLENFDDSKDVYSKHQNIKVSQLSESDNISDYSVQLETITDGALWEPAYIAAKTIMRLNSKHPYWDLVSSDKVNAEQVLKDILGKLSNLEYESIKDSNRKLLENTRMEMSRSLRIAAERLNIH